MRMPTLPGGWVKPDGKRRFRGSYIELPRGNAKSTLSSAEGSTLDGLNIHFGCIDELHAHRRRTLHDVVETGTGAREDSRLWVITTAGSNRSGICYEVRTFVTRLPDGVFEDDMKSRVHSGSRCDWRLQPAAA